MGGLREKMCFPLQWGIREEKTRDFCLTGDSRRENVCFRLNGGFAKRKRVIFGLNGGFAKRKGVIFA